MSDITKKDLRELAEKATRGPWWIDSHGHRMSSEGGMTTVFIADDRMGKATRHPETGNLSHWPNDWDASFIASANPKTIIGLLDEIEALEAECDTLRQQIDEARDEISQHSNVLTIAYMAGAADMRQQCNRLAGLLRMVRQDGWYHPLEEHEIAQIDSALAEVYQDRTGQLFHRTPEDFMERMEPVAAARQEVK